MGEDPRSLRKADCSNFTRRCHKNCTPYFLLESGRGFQNLLGCGL